MPRLEKLYQQEHRNGLEVVAVNVAGDDLSTVRKYVKQEGFTFPVVLSGTNHDAAIHAAERYGIQGTPDNFIVDSSGQIAAHPEEWDDQAVRLTLASLGVGDNARA